MKKKLRTNKRLVNLLRHETPKQRQKFLNEVDHVLCEVFGLEYKDLPWRNLNVCDKDWDKYVGDVRLAISKTLVEFNKNNNRFKKLKSPMEYDSLIKFIKSNEKETKNK